MKEKQSVMCPDLMVLFQCARILDALDDGRRAFEVYPPGELAGAGRRWVVLTDDPYGGEDGVLRFEGETCVDALAQYTQWLCVEAHPVLDTSAREVRA